MHNQRGNRRHLTGEEERFLTRHTHHILFHSRFIFLGGVISKLSWDIFSSALGLKGVVSFFYPILCQSTSDDPIPSHLFHHLLYPPPDLLAGGVVVVVQLLGLLLLELAQRQTSGRLEVNLK